MNDPRVPLGLVALVPAPVGKQWSVSLEFRPDAVAVYGRLVDVARPLAEQAEVLS